MARYDLLDPQGKYDIPRMRRLPAGGIDTKFTTYDKFKKLQFVGVGAPTAYPLPFFKWSSSGFNVSHVGHPDEFDFAPVENVWGSCT
ncbi:hypothetical protein MTO96_043780 [Rhipicephalus appendiculatus]